MKPLLSDLNLASDSSAAINLLALTFIPQAWQEIANACEADGRGNETEMSKTTNVTNEAHFHRHNLRSDPANDKNLFVEMA